MCLIKREGPSSVESLNFPYLVYSEEADLHMGASMELLNGEVVGTDHSPRAPLRDALVQRATVNQLLFLVLCRTWGSVDSWGSHVSLSPALEKAGTVIAFTYSPFHRDRKVKPGEVKWPAQCHTAGGGRAQFFMPGSHAREVSRSSLGRCPGFQGKGDNPLVSF